MDCIYCRYITYVQLLTRQVVAIAYYIYCSLILLVTMVALVYVCTSYYLYCVVENCLGVVHAAIWDDFQHELCVVQMLYITLIIFSVWLGILIPCDV